MAGLDREGGAFVPANGGTGVVGGGAFAAHFVEAVAFAGGLVIPAFHKLAGVKVRAAIAFIVDALAVEHFRPTLLIQLRHAFEGQDVGHHGGHDFRNGWAPGNLDDRFVVDHLVHRGGLGRVGGRCLHASVGCARPPRDDGLAVLGRMGQLVQERLAADDAGHAILVQGWITFHRQNVVAVIFVDGFFDDGFRLVAGSGHDRIVIIQ